MPTDYHQGGHKKKENSAFKRVLGLTLLHSERPKLRRVLVVLRAFKGYNQPMEIIQNARIKIYHEWVAGIEKIVPGDHCLATFGKPYAEEV